MKLFRFNPQTQKKLRRFREIKRGYYSFLILMTFLVLSLFGEMLINNRALIVSYDGELFFPTYSDFHAGTDFGLDYPYEVNYRELAEKFEQEQSDNWVLMPLVPYSPYETAASTGIFRPEPPDASKNH